MISKDAFDKYLADLHAHINKIEADMKKETENRLQTARDNYEKALRDRIAHEITLRDEAYRQRNDVAVNHHKLLAEVYQSMLDNHLLHNPPNGSTTQSEPPENSA